MTKKANTFPRVMKGTAALSGAAAAGLFLLCPRWPGLLPLAITAFTVCYHFTMRLLVGYLVPLRLGNPSMTERSWFRPRPFEKKLYKTLRVKAWKAHMPTYDPSSFSLAENTLEQVVHNSCISEAVHEVIILCSFLPLLFSLFWGELPVFIITSVLAALFDSLFAIMQRYNRPRLQRILLKKEGSRL